MLIVDSYSRKIYRFGRGRIYRALASGAGRIWMPETMPMAITW